MRDLRGGSTLGKQIILVALRVTLMGLALVLWLAPRTAHAYPWMLRHGYTACATCHTDPSGSGLLTPYGRAQGDLLLRTHYGNDAGADMMSEPDKTAGFLFGAVEPPEWLTAGGYFRGMGLAVKPDGASLSNSFILMQADLQAEARFGNFRVNGSLGVVSSDGSAASVVSKLVSREHWLGYSFADDRVLVRAGRLNLPFGIRTIEHTLFVRSATRTDLNDTQQHGVAVAYSGQDLRGELMGIAGNYQIRPDAYRERGYSGFLEYALGPWATAGVSSLLTRTDRDLYLRVPNTRQAHGAFARLAPFGPLVLMLEADYLRQTPDGTDPLSGYALLASADIEPTQGLHLILTGEATDTGGALGGTSWGAWAGVGWFLLPHTDVRLDVMRRELVLGSTTVGMTAGMAQLHVYL